MFSGGDQNKLAKVSAIYSAIYMGLDTRFGFDYNNYVGAVRPVIGGALDIFTLEFLGKFSDRNVQKASRTHVFKLGYFYAGDKKRGSHSIFAEYNFFPTGPLGLSFPATVEIIDRHSKDRQNCDASETPTQEYCGPKQAIGFSFGPGISIDLRRVANGPLLYDLVLNIQSQVGFVKDSFGDYSLLGGLRITMAYRQTMLVKTTAPIDYDNMKHYVVPI